MWLSIFTFPIADNMSQDITVSSVNGTDYGISGQHGLLESLPNHQIRGKNVGFELHSSGLQRVLAINVKTSDVPM